MTGKEKNTKRISGKDQSSKLIEERMRIFANLVIDRILEDRQNGKLKLGNENG